MPPENKPTPQEITTCRDFLIETIAEMARLKIIIALGRIAHDSAVRALGARLATVPFGHAESHQIGKLRLLDSYHCSRYNTNTGVLTEEMFRTVFRTARRFLDQAEETAPA